MSKITAYKCDFCELPKEATALAGFTIIKDRLEECHIEKSSKHICYKCASKLSQMVENKLQKKMIGSNS
jgi:hypothetical protein